MALTLALTRSEMMKDILSSYIYIYIFSRALVIYLSYLNHIDMITLMFKIDTDKSYPQTAISIQVCSRSAKSNLYTRNDDAQKVDRVPSII